MTAKNTAQPVNGVPEHPLLTKPQEAELGKTKDFHEYVLAHQQLINEGLPETVENVLERLNENHGIEFTQHEHRKKDWFNKKRLEILLTDYHESKGNANPPEGLQQLIEDAREHVENEDLEKTGRAALNARNELVTKNRKLAAYIQAKFKALPPKTQREDALQMAYEGLLRAATHYDYTQGNKFSAYAIHWIKNAINKGIKNKGRTIRTPIHLQDDITKYWKVAGQSASKIGRLPTPTEVSQQLGWNLEKTNKIMRIARITGALSLNQHLNPQDPQPEELMNVIAGQTAETVTRTLEKKEFHETLQAALTPREYGIIIKRYGLDGNKPKTLQEIGDVYGVSREAIRQIEAKILKKLEENRRIQELK